MARTVDRLNPRFVQSVKTPGRHADGAGLYLQVDKSEDPEKAGAKRWVFVFQWNRARKEMGLGGLNACGLGEARKKAIAARKLVGEGKNPIEERKALAEEGRSFGEVADSVMAAKEPQWTNEKHKGQWKTSLEVHAKAIRGKDAAQVTTDDVLELLKPIWTTIPETASRTRGRVEHVLDAARAKGLIASPWENPARWKGHLALLLPKRRKLTRGHHPAMPFGELPAFMADLRTREATAARALELTILTAARTSEAILARWQEFDLKAALWTVPAERMKRRIEHRVPLPAAAVALLVALREAPGAKLRPTDYVFPGDKAGEPLSNMAMTMLLRRMEKPDFSVHGFRSTFRDWAGETTNFAREVVEAALSHAVGDEVERAYRRGDALAKRRKLMDAWAGYCGRVAGGKVLAFTRARAAAPE
ncbi:MAG: tyrosine-type recombinase/integrase [Caulobacterales bacterium]|nr:tyrosine-type recombinase/integrase [Caulobacterales bacterium]